MIKRAAVRRQLSLLAQREASEIVALDLTGKSANTVIGVWHLSGVEAITQAVADHEVEHPTCSYFIGVADRQPGFMDGRAKTTNIAATSCIVFDIDPVRPAGTPATAEQTEAAETAAYLIDTWMTREGGYLSGHVACSGNGYYLFYPIPRIEYVDEPAFDRKVAAFMEKLRPIVEHLPVKLDHTQDWARLIRLVSTENRKGPDPELWRDSEWHNTVLSRDRDAQLGIDILNLTAAPMSGVVDRPVPPYDYGTGPPVSLQGKILDVWEGRSVEIYGDRSSGLFALLGHLYLRGVPDATAVAAVAACDDEHYRKFTGRTKPLWENFAAVERSAKKPTVQDGEYHFAGRKYAINDGGYTVERLTGEDKGRTQILSDFVFQDTKLIELGSELWLKARILKRSGYTLNTQFKLPTANFTSGVPSLGGLWYGGSPDLGHVLGWVTEEAPIIPGIGYVGRHSYGGKPIFAVGDGSIYSREGLLESPPVQLVQQFGHTPRTTFCDRPLEDASSLGKSLLALNHPSITWPVMAWFFASYFAPQIRSKTGHYPLLSVFGTPGGGKTMLAQLALRFVTGCAAELLKAGTNFSIICQLASSNTIPVAYDEVRRRDIGSMRLLEHAKECYAGEHATRGNANQQLNVYSMIAPVCMIGETDPRGSDVALSDRIISVELPPRTDRTEAMQSAYRTLFRLNDSVAAQAAYKLMLESLTCDFDAMWTKTSEPDFGDVNDRERDNIRACLIGAQAFTQVFELPEEYYWSAVDVLKTYYSPNVEQDDTANDRIRPQLHTWLEQLATLAGLGKLQRGRDYETAGDDVKVVTSNAWAVYDQEFARSREVLEADKGTVRRWLRRDPTGLIIDDALIFKCGGMTKRGFVLSRTEAINLGIDIYGFQEE